MKYDTIILIDDDPIVRYGFKRLIKGFFAEQAFLTFENAKESLDYFVALDTDNFSKKILVLLDLNMPMLNGWSFLEQFKEECLANKEHITIYILSSTIDPNEIKRIKANKLVSGHITKPLTLEELKDLLTDEFIDVAASK